MNPADLVEAVLVHYGTPRLTHAAVWSLRTCYPDLPITVLENGSPDGSRADLERWAEEVPFTLVTSGANLHHGPGMDLLIRQSTRPWVLVFDTDALAFRPGFLEALIEAVQAPRVFMAGLRIHVDGDGFNVAPEAPGAIPYVHPYCALVRRETYLLLPPFEKHGAPCLASERAAQETGHALTHVPVDSWVYHLGRGTAGRYGYGLGLRGHAARLRRLVRRLRP